MFHEKHNTFSRKYVQNPNIVLFWSPQAAHTIFGFPHIYDEICYVFVWVVVKFKCFTKNIALLVANMCKTQILCYSGLLKLQTQYLGFPHIYDEIWYVLYVILVIFSVLHIKRSLFPRKVAQKSKSMVSGFGDHIQVYLIFATKTHTRFFDVPKKTLIFCKKITIFY